MEGPQVVTMWRKSTFSTPENDCVELAGLSDGGTAVRDSKQGDGGPILRFAQADMATFIRVVKG